MTNIGIDCEKEAVEDRRRQVVTLTQQGQSAAQIAAQLGITPRTVFRYRRHCGIAHPPHRRMTEAELQRAEEMLDDGCSFAEVARTLGYSLDGIRYHFPGRGWTHEQIVAWACLHQRRRHTAHVSNTRK